VTDKELLEKAIKAAEEFTQEYADDLKALQQIERAELIQELETKKKENFQKISDACLQEYEKKYGARPEDEHWIYMVSSYGATGEGETTCLMVTQAVPSCVEDFTEDDKYFAVTTQEYRAVREFHKQFGTFMLYGLQFVSKEEFYTQYAYFIPPVVMKLSNAKCYKNFYTQVHYNFS
jgi:hypothetical protein